MNKLKRLLKEAQQELDKAMEEAYVVYRRKDLILARKYFKRLAAEYEETPVLHACYTSSANMLMDLIFNPEAIARFCKIELERQEQEEEER